MSLRSVCVFCGSSFGRDPIYAEIARRLGEVIAASGLSLVYGGGNIGLMGTIADSVLKSSGKVVGVIPSSLAAKEIVHTGLTELHVVDSMHERKHLMAEKSDGFIAIPGGYGTLDEFCEVLTWNQLGLISKPTAILNINSFFDSFLAFIDHATKESFIRPESRNRLVVDEDPNRIISKMNAWCLEKRSDRQ